jgi:hypothetical protein
MGLLNSPRACSIGHQCCSVLRFPQRRQAIRLHMSSTYNQPLECIQVSQFVPVDRHVVPEPRFRHAVDRKANPLIHRYEEIKQHKRKDAGVDKRRRKNCQNPGVHGVAEKGSLQPSVLLLDFLGEPYLPVAQFDLSSQEIRRDAGTRTNFEYLGRCRDRQGPSERYRFRRPSANNQTGKASGVQDSSRRNTSA